MRRAAILPEGDPFNLLRMLRTACVICGALLLAAGGRYHGPGEILVHSYVSNIAFSFAAYFLIFLARIRVIERRWRAAGVALSVAMISELLQGIRLLDGVFDPWDFAANGLGVALALVTDRFVERVALK
ncbi:MAG: hypothetical protein IPG71_10755 [bacterium]|nr:hypothetical protein [bacterium]